MSRFEDEPAAASGEPGSDASDPTPETDDIHGSPDATLGGYLSTHDRPPAFEGPDGHPYTVSIEAERTPDLRNPFEGYLVFPRWAANGMGITGHVETDTLWRGRTPEEITRQAGDTPLLRVKALLDDAVHRSREPQDAPSDAS